MKAVDAVKAREAARKPQRPPPPPPPKRTRKAPEPEPEPTWTAEGSTWSDITAEFVEDES